MLPGQVGSVVLLGVFEQGKQGTSNTPCRVGSLGTFITYAGEHPGQFLYGIFVLHDSISILKQKYK